MGSTFAPDFAHLYMGMFEYNFVFNPDRNPFYQKNSEVVYSRYLDDIFCLFQGNLNLCLS